MIAHEKQCLSYAIMDVSETIAPTQQRNGMLLQHNARKIFATEAQKSYKRSNIFTVQFRSRISVF